MHVAFRKNFNAENVPNYGIYNVTGRQLSFTIATIILLVTMYRVTIISDTDLVMVGMHGNIKPGCMKSLG